jgi:hypothetical protein
MPDDGERGLDRIVYDEYIDPTIPISVAQNTLDRKTQLGTGIPIGQDYVSQ